LSRVLFLVVFLLAIYAVQRFWFLRAWSAISSFATGSVQIAFHLGLIALAATLLASLLDGLLGHAVSKLNVGSFHLGKNLITLARLWVVASTFGLIAVEAVSGVEWITNLAASISARFRDLPAASAGDFSHSRRAFFHYASIIAGSFPFLAATYGFAAGRLRYTVERVDVPVENLPVALEGLRIAQLSDIHIGDYMPPLEIARAVEMANELRPDLTVVTGDFVSSVGDPLDACIRQLANLRAPLGVWGCNGNHEIYAGVEDEAERLFERNGMRLLRARNQLIAHNGAQFNLIGVDYQRDHMVTGERTGPMLQEIEHLVRRDIPNILLSHNPNSFPRAAKLGIELSLAGHTHGGQVKVEIVDHSVSPARLISPFVAGLYRLPMEKFPAIGSEPSGKSFDANRSSAHKPAPKAALYVNRGLGTFGFPVRLGVPPEITLLTLKRA
jgi:uncharacterized protein